MALDAYGNYVALLDTLGPAAHVADAAAGAGGVFSSDGAPGADVGSTATDAICIDRQTSTLYYKVNGGAWY